MNYFIWRILTKAFFLYIVVDIIVSLFEQVNGVYCFCYCLVTNNISLFVTLWNVVHQAPLSSTIYQSLLKFTSFKSVMLMISSSVTPFSFCFQSFHITLINKGYTVIMVEKYLFNQILLDALWFLIYGLFK